MNAAPSLSLVGTDALPLYPISAKDRLSSHSWLAFDYDRWGQSAFRARADLEVRAVFLELICAAQKGTPVGTLPVDEDLLADAVRLPLDHWRRLCQRPIGPLYGWHKCLCDNGEIRLFHKVVQEVVQDALKGRSKYLASAAADRERKRLADLPRQILRGGGSQRMAEDQAYVLRLDQYLLDYLPEGKSRTIKAVKAAMEAMDLGQTGTLMV